MTSFLTIVFPKIESTQICGESNDKVLVNGPICSKKNGMNFRPYSVKSLCVLT